MERKRLTPPSLRHSRLLPRHSRESGNPCPPRRACMMHTWRMQARPARPISNRDTTSATIPQCAGHGACWGRRDAGHGRHGHGAPPPVTTERCGPPSPSALADRTHRGEARPSSPPPCQGGGREGGWNANASPRQASVIPASFPVIPAKAGIHVRRTMHAWRTQARPARRRCKSSTKTYQHLLFGCSAAVAVSSVSSRQRHRSQIILNCHEGCPFLL